VLIVFGWQVNKNTHHLDHQLGYTLLNHPSYQGILVLYLAYLSHFFSILPRIFTEACVANCIVCITLNKWERKRSITPFFFYMLITSPFFVL
jgi:protein-S-isoprenylcysteine O-methyltransferase Ste14